MGLAETFKALSDPVRREILTVSYHLSQLKKAELILEERQKNFIYYRLNTSVFEEMMLWIAQFSDRKEEGKENEK